MSAPSHPSYGSTTFSVHKLPWSGGSGGHYGTFLFLGHANHLKKKLEARDKRNGYETKYVVRMSRLGPSQDVAHLMEDYHEESES